MNVPMLRARVLAASLLLVLMAGPAIAAPDPVGALSRTSTPALPEFSAADPSAAVVSDANVMQSERFWPYMVALTEAWRIAAENRTLRVGTEGVVVRVVDRERVRLDLGRDGLVEVPVAATDLIARANAIRTGAARKDAPNLTWAIGARILDGSADEVALYGMENALSKRGYLMVFVDPSDAPTYAAMASALASLNERHDVLTIVVPQGRASDDEMLALQKKSGWTAAFMLGHLALPYTQSLLPGGTHAPYVMLQTDEGRVVEQGVWSDELAARLARALDATFGPGDAAVAAQ